MILWFVFGRFSEVSQLLLTSIVVLWATSCHAKFFLFSVFEVLTCFIIKHLIRSNRLCKLPIHRDRTTVRHTAWDIFAY